MSTIALAHSQPRAQTQPNPDLRPHSENRMQIALFSLSLLFSCALAAHGDAEHEHEPTKVAPLSQTPVTADRPQQLADGRVFLPKSSQRQWQLTTQLPQVQSLAVSLQLNAHVITDPQTSGKVQSSLTGRIEAGPKGLAMVGQKVQQGQVLALVRPSSSAIERSNQQAQLAQLQAQRTARQNQLARYRQLSHTIAAKDQQSLEAELHGIEQSIRALNLGLNAIEELRAPVSGIIAQSNVIQGQMVDAQSPIFEIINPDTLLIEALVYDVASAQQLTSAHILGDPEPLQRVAIGAALQEGALPVWFRRQAGASALAVGQPLTLLAQTGQEFQGVALPLAAIVKNSANENRVWLQEAPEYFRSVPVQLQNLDGNRVALLHWQLSQPIVVTGASLLNQIR